MHLFYTTEKDDIVKLLKSNASVNIQDNRGCTSLFQIIQNQKNTNKEELVRLLISHGADINHRDFTGISPLEVIILFLIINLFFYFLCSIYLFIYFFKLAITCQAKLNIIKLLSTKEKQTKNPKK